MIGVRSTKGWLILAQYALRAIFVVGFVLSRPSDSRSWSAEYLSVRDAVFSGGAFDTGSSEAHCWRLMECALAPLSMIQTPEIHHLAISLSLTLADAVFGWSLSSVLGSLTPHKLVAMNPLLIFGTLRASPSHLGGSAVGLSFLLVARGHSIAAIAVASLAAMDAPVQVLHLGLAGLSYIPVRSKHGCLWGRYVRCIAGAVVGVAIRVACFVGSPGCTQLPTEFGVLTSVGQMQAACLRQSFVEAPTSPGYWRPGIGLGWSLFTVVLPTYRHPIFRLLRGLPIAIGSSALWRFRKSPFAVQTAVLQILLLLFDLKMESSSVGLLFVWIFSNKLVLSRMRRGRALALAFITAGAWMLCGATRHGWIYAGSYSVNVFYASTITLSVAMTLLVTTYIAAAGQVTSAAIVPASSPKKDC